MQAKKEGFLKEAPDSFFSSRCVGTAVLNLYTYSGRKHK